MAKIKIISNPYKKEIVYQKWSEPFEVWTTIDASVSRNSKLLSEELTHGFFPFRAKQIIDAIVEEYSSENESINIIFEGSLDEFKDLEDACSGVELADKVTIEKSDLILENARDILPGVRKLFLEISPLIHQSASEERISRDLNRFTDASSDMVPVCVLGNYSAGKSTFINALIGSEILPTGTEPITAKIYKIARSKYSDRASIQCQTNNQKIFLLFKSDETSFEGGKPDNPLADMLQETLDHIKHADIVDRVRESLRIINSYEDSTEEEMVSDLIEVEIPFVRGVLAQSQHPFVIIDTPGSNSASNARHLQVLKLAMANMTNGLPIFLCTPEALDSTDNESLYHIIRDMEELDNRFTMIVVNKADGIKPQTGSSLTFEQQRVLSQAVPRNLYSGGLFYVSSILGLGAKNDGEFYDESYAETYDEQVYKYNDPSGRRYRTLYTLNIMPAHLKQRADELAAQQTDLVYANSGLFSIETEIETFAGKYSSYNKCFQSQMFLKNVIRITEEEIEDKKEAKNGIRQTIINSLEQDKQNLMQHLEAKAAEERDGFDQAYGKYMGDYLIIIMAGKTISVKQLETKESELFKSYEEEMRFEEYREGTKNAVAAVGDNFISRINNPEKKFDFSVIKKVASGFRRDAGAAIDSISAQREMRHKVNKAVSEKLLEYVSEMYENGLSELYELLEGRSRSYWTENTEALRLILAKIVTGSDVFTEERRQELEKIIITYQSISFRENRAKDIFDQKKFEKRFLFWQSDRLNLDKIASVYRDQFHDDVDERCKSIEESHRESAYNWIRSLLDEIIENIVSYSPELSKKAKQIEDLAAEIEDLIQRQLKLKEYTERLGEMMDWKVVLS